MAGRLRAVLLVALFVLTVVLGSIGLEDCRHFPYLSFAYDLLGLFGIGSANACGVTDPDWPLDVARLTGLAVTAGVVLGFVLTWGETRLHRFAARRASGHTVVLGPTERVTAYVRGANRGRVVVQGDSIRRDASGGSLHVQIDWAGIGFVRDVAAQRARRIVIASGDDEINAGLLAKLPERTKASAEDGIVMEIDDRSVALSLSVALTLDDPDRRLEVVCRDESGTALAAERLLAGHDDAPTAAILGDGAIAEMLVATLGRRLRELASRDSRTRSRLAVVEPSQAVRNAIERRPLDSADLVVRWFDHVDGLLAWEPGRLAAVVDFRDAARGLRVASELACLRPGSRVLVSTSADRLPVQGLEPISLAELLDADALTGPFTRVARLRQDDANRRDPSVPDFRDLDAESAALACRTVRRLVAALAEQGWLIAPTTRVGEGDELIDRSTLALLARVDDGELGALDLLPSHLHMVGLSVIGPQSLIHPGGASSPDSLMPDDDVIEIMARQIHARYLSENAGIQPPEHPAMHPWDQLDEKLKAQNRNQARDNVLKLASIGVAVATAEQARDRGADPIHTLASDSVEMLARREHDRWARQKRAQGYRYGPVRIDAAPDHQHPDLLAWDDLPDATREKDRSPIRAIPDVLGEVGLVAVDVSALDEP